LGFIELLSFIGFGFDSTRSGSCFGLGGRDGCGVSAGGSARVSAGGSARVSAGGSARVSAGFDSSTTAGCGVSAVQGVLGEYVTGHA
jgi:hypothetical protein